MVEVFAFLLGAVLGGVLAWLWGDAKARTLVFEKVAGLEARLNAAESLRDGLHHEVERKEKEVSDLRASLESERLANREAQIRLAAAHENLQAQKRLLEEATTKLTETFKALSSDALRSNNQSFLELAKQSLEAIVNQAKGDIGVQQEAIDALINPLQESLKRYEEQIDAIEESRQRAYGSLEGQLSSLSTTTVTLCNALRTPDVRGRWGEITLRRTAELAGLSAHCDYVEQATVDSDGGRLRPDMTVRLPGNREIFVDAKVPLSAYLDAISASNEEQRNAAMARHARQFRTHMNQLAAKAYWAQSSITPEFVVMFVPGEAFLAAAVDTDRSLFEDAIAKHVIMATPATLAALLRVIAYGWRQEGLTENARVISDLGKQLYDRLKALADHFCEIGKSLEKAVSAYNKAVGSLESRVLPSARRFGELGAATIEEIQMIGTIDRVPRSLVSGPDIDDPEKEATQPPE